MGLVSQLSARHKRRAENLFGAPGTPEIAIIGGGFGGIGLSIRLKQIGISTFRVFAGTSASPGMQKFYPAQRVVQQQGCVIFAQILSQVEELLERLPLLQQ